MTETIALPSRDSSSLNWSFDYPLQHERPTEIRLGAREIPPWLEPVAARINRLAMAPAYDPRGVRPVNVPDLVNALSFLTRVMRPETIPPWIGLLSSGGLQLTWQQDDVEVEVVFDQARDDSGIYIAVGGNEWEAPIDDGDSLFCTVVDRISNLDVGVAIP